MTVQAGDFANVEKELKIDTFPSVVAIEVEKKKVATLKGGFSEESLSAFLTDLSSG